MQGRETQGRIITVDKLGSQKTALSHCLFITSQHFLVKGEKNIIHVIHNFRKTKLENICFGCSKEPSEWDGSFGYPQHICWLRNMKKNYTFMLYYLYETVNKLGSQKTTLCHYFLITRQQFLVIYNVYVWIYKYFTHTIVNTFILSYTINDLCWGRHGVLLNSKRHWSTRSNMIKFTVQ